MVRSLSTWIVIAGTCLNTTVATAGGGAEIPDRLAPAQEAGSSEATWIWESAASFKDSMGEWHVEKLPPSTLSLIDTYVARQAKGELVRDCIGMKQPVVDPVPGRLTRPQSLSEVLAQAREILSGQVVGSTPGFLWGDPVSLLAVEVSDRLRTEVPANEPAPSIVYIAYPKARFSVDRYVFCRDPDGELPDPPTNGGEVLLISLTGAAEEAPELFGLYPTGDDLYWTVSAGTGVASTGFIALQANALSGVNNVTELRQLVQQEIEEGQP